MEDQKATKPQVKFDTMKAFAGMGAAVEVLMKAAPNAFTHATVSGKEQQGKLRRRKAAIRHIHCKVSPPSSSPVATYNIL